MCPGAETNLRQFAVYSDPPGTKLESLGQGLIELVIELLQVTLAVRQTCPAVRPAGAQRYSSAIGLKSGQPRVLRGCIGIGLAELLPTMDSPQAVELLTIGHRVKADRALRRVMRHLPGARLRL